MTYHGYKLSKIIKIMSQEPCIKIIGAIHLTFAQKSIS